MRTDRIKGSLPTTQQNSPIPPANSSHAGSTTFTRSLTQPTLVQPTQSLAASNTINQPPVNKTNELRMAINHGWPDLSYEKWKNLFSEQNHLSPSAGVRVRKEYAFGVSNSERLKLLPTIENDIFSGHVRHCHNPNSINSLTNPDAVNTLRQAALNWSRVPGNDFSKIAPEDFESFLREMVNHVPTQHRHAAWALATQPEQYMTPLPATIAHQLMAQYPPPPNPLPMGPSMPSATHQGTAAMQSQPFMALPQAGPSSTPAASIKRSASYASSGPVSSNDPSPIFKRSRPDDVGQAPSFAAHQSAAVVPATVRPAFNGTSGPTAQYQPMANNFTVQGYGTGAASAAPQSVQGMPAGPSQPALAAMQAPFQTGTTAMSDHELGRVLAGLDPSLMQTIDNLTPISARTQEHVVTPLLASLGIPATPATAPVGQMVTVMPPMPVHVQTVPLAQPSPLPGQAAQTAFFNPFDPSDPLNGTVLPWTTTPAQPGQQAPR